MMERVNEILQDPLYRTCLSKIAFFERDRIFCGHDMAHFLDVARLAYLFNLEENLKLEKEEIYTAALLHDVGRFVQYEDGTPHQLASLPLAEKLMDRHGYTEEEKANLDKQSIGVANVVGSTVEGAHAALSRQGFQVIVQPETVDGKEEVLDQFPKAGTKAESGSTVFIYTE